MQRIQGVVVGDYGVGKTSLLYAMVGKPVPQDHVPTLMESHMVVVEVGDGKKIEFVVWDTPGSDDHQQLTEMGLAKKDIVVLCFSLVDDKSYQRVKSKVSSISVYNETSLHSSSHTTSLISLLPCLSSFNIFISPHSFHCPSTWCIFFLPVASAGQKTLAHSPYCAGGYQTGPAEHASCDRGPSWQRNSSCRQRARRRDERKHRSTHLH